MHKLSIIIIEDEFFAASHLGNLLDSLGYVVKAIYHSGEEFMRKTDWQFDAAALDIFLSGALSGLDIAAGLSERAKPFVFITANQDVQTLKNAARLQPKAYITKPFRENDVKAAFEMIAYGSMRKILIRTASGKEELHPGDILFIRSDGVYIEIITLDARIVQRKLLREIEAELPGNFVRVHRSYIVNKAHIGQRSASRLFIHGHEIPVSRQFRDLF